MGLAFGFVGEIGGVGEGFGAGAADFEVHEDGGVLGGDVVGERGGGFGAVAGVEGAGEEGAAGAHEGVEGDEMAVAAEDLGELEGGDVVDA